KNAEYLKDLFKSAYLEHENLSDATRYLVNELFGKYGLVIIDGDDNRLKKLFSPYIKQELVEQTSYKEVNETLKHFNYPVQVNPREINLFYLDKNLRERIIYQNGKYEINNTDFSFTQEEILELTETHPEKFSPNVILRPLYQEVILPNLCYIGGGGELAYWLELKKVFEVHQTPFPILLLRNSVLLATKKQNQKIEKLHLSWEELFLKKQAFIQKKTHGLSDNAFDFEQQKAFLRKQFDDLHSLIQTTHPSFAGAVKAQEEKQIKGLENLEKRYYKAERL